MTDCASGIVTTHDLNVTGINCNRIRLKWKRRY